MKAGASIHDEDDFVLYVAEPGCHAKLWVSPAVFWNTLLPQVMAHKAHLETKYPRIPAEAVSELLE